MIAESVIAKLSATAGVTAIIGASTACRAYHIIAPVEPVAPYAVLQVISSTPHVTFNEASGSSEQELQIACIAATPAAARALAAAVVAALDNQTLAGGERCLSCAPPTDGYSSSTDQAVCNVDATFFVPA